MRRKISFLNTLITIFILLFLATTTWAAAINNPWTSGHYRSDTNTRSQTAQHDTTETWTEGVFYGTTPLEFDGLTYDTYKTWFSFEDPTALNYQTFPNYGGAVPLIVQQGYTQFSHSEATTVDVTGAALTLADGFFVEGKTFRIKAGGTVTGTNGAITVALYLEDGAVCTLTTGTAAAGDWTAEFVIVATAAAAQRIIGTLIAGAGTDPISDYAADTTDTASAGTIPLKLQVGLANASDTITCEYWSIEHWSKAD